MAIEIEIKAWVDDPIQVQNRIGSFATFIKTYEKDDAYWLPTTEIETIQNTQKRGPLGSGIRIRQENGSVFVTLKKKEVREGMEINDELEFSVSRATAFEDFLHNLGFVPWIRKHKEGQAWRWNNITIELSQVKHLGWFVELEILTDTYEPEQIELARKELYACLHKIGIPESNIETRYYTELLLERINSNHRED
ncbi:class IV adenylate cyclase [Gracilinema caldarium]|uniref:Adenylyl cyclase CyaB n=1 Tax=Gracilinema caldarium (strain ATCC 51460 / DSM 7334 / H1) TaxID=744872 RepID=F8EXE6_GRAC1|nr:class IV adenylate cyclase [Gracilinema caldarium]AEJ19173.1 adenylyl cyclase CyaB [Gracilinema caldarium DSM 7334]